MQGMSPDRRFFIIGACALVGGLAVPALWGRGSPEADAFELSLSEEEWRKRLSPEEFAVLREADTERPYSSDLLGEKRAGLYICAGCDLDLYQSKTKFDSGTGWPSFYAALPDAVGTRSDYSLILPRTEVHCRRCGGHLGHVFDDGPPPTGKRHCINGIALDFRPA